MAFSRSPKSSGSAVGPWRPPVQPTGFESLRSTGFRQASAWGLVGTSTRAGLGPALRFRPASQRRCHAHRHIDIHQPLDAAFGRLHPVLRHIDQRAADRHRRGRHQHAEIAMLADGTGSATASAPAPRRPPRRRRSTTPGSSISDRPRLRCDRRWRRSAWTDRRHWRRAGFAASANRGRPGSKA